MGTLVKRLVCSAAGLDPAAVYHAAVMPCYDKKLEASRADFNLPGAHPHPLPPQAVRTACCCEKAQCHGAAASAALQYVS